MDVEIKLLEKGVINITSDNYVSFLKKGIKDKLIPIKLGFDKVVVTYLDKKTKEFDYLNWLTFRSGIITNLYLNKRCTIEFFLNKRLIKFYGK